MWFAHVFTESIALGPRMLRKQRRNNTVIIPIITRNVKFYDIFTQIRAPQLSLNRYQSLSGTIFSLEIHWAKPPAFGGPKYII